MLQLRSKNAFILEIPIAMFEFSWIRPCFLVLLSVTAATAADFDVESLQERIYATIESVKPAVVSVRQRGGMFSGVIVSKDGQVLSAGHAVRPGDRYQVLLPDGRQLTAVGKGSNPQADCALLQITSDVEDLPYVRMGESDSLVRNQPCLSVSFPGGQGARGVPIVRFGRLVNTGGGRRMLQSTALMEPGDSGGPLFDLQGRVIGIHSRIGQSMTRNYEVDVNTFKKFWNELNREQSFTQSGPPVPKLGFRGVDRGDGIGISVMEIVENSLAANHGIEPEDVIQTVYGRETPSIKDLRRALVAARDDKTKEIVVKIRREEKEVEITMPFDVESESAPPVELPVYGEQEFSSPEAIDQLANLPKVFSELESKLDDSCVAVSSKLADGEEVSIVGTLINSTSFIVSKSSMVSDSPTAKFGDTTLDLEVVIRDRENDLVLLKSPTPNAAGIDLSTSFEQPTKDDR